MSDGEMKAKEVSEIVDGLDAAHDWQSEEKLHAGTAFLVGDTSAREKVRRFLNSAGRIRELLSKY